MNESLIFLAVIGALVLILFLTVGAIVVIRSLIDAWGGI